MACPRALHRLPKEATPRSASARRRSHPKVRSTRRSRTRHSPEGSRRVAETQHALSPRSSSRPPKGALPFASSSPRSRSLVSLHAGDPPTTRRSRAGQLRLQRPESRRPLRPSARARTRRSALQLRPKTTLTSVTRRPPRPRPAPACATKVTLPFACPPRRVSEDTRLSFRPAPAHDSRDQQPPEPGETSRVYRNRLERSHRQHSDPSRDRAAPPLGGNSFSPDLPPQLPTVRPSELRSI